MIRFGMCRDRSLPPVRPPDPLDTPGLGSFLLFAADFWMESGALPWLSQCSGNSQWILPFPPPAKGPHSIPNPKPNLIFIGSG